jgi:hypothetical protein
MASDKVQFAVSITPCEMVGTSSEGSAQNFIAASEAYGSGGGSGEVTGLDIISGGGAGDGYDDGAKYYQTAVAIAEDNATNTVANNDLGVMDASTGIEFLYIKHTGFEFNSSTVLGNANTVDVLSVLAAFAADQYVTIARLKAGEAIVLPIRSKTTVVDHSLVVDGTKILVASTDGTNYDGTIGVNSIAIEFLAVGA